MKKGFIFALLMVGMVAMTMPAGALAPTMPNMPDIIIGDAGDLAGSGTPALRLLRYVNVMDLAGAIGRPNNPSTATALSVWYWTDQPSTGALRASNPSALVAPMTTAEASSLTATGAQPSAVKKIGGPVWLSLIENSPGAGKTSPTSAISATPTSNGATIAEFSAKGVTSTPATCRLYAVDSDALTTAVGVTNAFKVYAQTNAEDGFSPVDTVASADFEGNSDGWTTFTYQSFKDLGYYDIGSFAETPTAIGYTGSASFASPTVGAYAQWANPSFSPPLVDVTGSAGKIFKAVMTLSGNAPAATGTPGYRVLYLSFGFCHVGGYQVTDTDTVGANLPSSGSQKVVNMAWECPYDLSDFADGGQLDHTASPALDLRDYYLIFDLVQLQAGETNSIMLENLDIKRLPRPLDAAPSLKYGAASANVNGAGLAFNAPVAQGGWQPIPGDFGTNFGEGTATISADSVVLARGTHAGNSGFKQAAPFSTATNMVPWASNQLLRFSVRISAANPLAYPAMRFFLLPYNAVGGTTLGDILWADTFDGTSIRGWYVPGTHTALGGSPKASPGSLLRFYAYSGSAMSGSPIILPSIDIAQAPITNLNTWPAPDSNMTISAYKIEVLAP